MKRRNLLASLLGIILIAVVSLAATLIAGRSPLLGLDLEGGVSVVLQPHGKVTPAVLQAAVNIIDRRVNGIGVANSTVQRQGNDVVIELPGVKNSQQALRTIGTTAELFFRPVNCTIPAYAAPAKSSTTTTTPKTSPTTTKTSPTTAKTSTAKTSATTAKASSSTAKASSSTAKASSTTAKASSTTAKASSTTAKASSSTAKASSTTAKAAGGSGATGTLTAESAGSGATGTLTALESAGSGATGTLTALESAGSGATGTLPALESAGSGATGTLPALESAGSGAAGTLTGLETAGSATTTPASATTVAPTVAPTTATTGPTSTATTVPSSSTTTTPKDSAAALANTCTSASADTVPSTSADNDDANNTVIVPAATGAGLGLDRWVLGPADLKGEIVKTASSALDTQNGEYVVNVTLTGSGLSAFNKVAEVRHSFYNASATSQAFTSLEAIELDGVLESAPTIETAPFTGPIQISGSFTAGQASTLATQLRYGSLPVRFDTGSISTVSATLGHSSLIAGLLAGLGGLVLVLIYMILYYRALGLVVVLGLGVGGAILYSILTELSFTSSLALTLSGIVGVIVSIGITVDSYVVYFERLKDEVRQGRTVRASVERGFTRAFKTVLTADLVSFMAALILYLFTVGDVKGFAFTLGLSTLLDVATAYLFIRPIVILLGRRRTTSETGFLGISRGLGSARPEGTA